ncbi:MAG: hypothetical protein OEU92_17325 [Alphaproteobacteria bacterium]|nr:hypothetical protein [Alphaproteobacteria bacterium]
MDIKEEVRRRIAELTQFAYQRGYRDGAQSALAEIESIATEDVVEQLAKEPAPIKAIPAKKAVAQKPATAKQAKAAKTKPAKATKSKAPAKRKAKANGKANDKDRGKPKTLVIQEAIQSQLDAKGEARRDEVLAAAQAENPAITKFDLGNGLRNLVKQSKVRVSPEDNGVLLPAA